MLRCRHCGLEIALSTVTVPTCRCEHRKDARIAELEAEVERLREFERLIGMALTTKAHVWTESAGIEIITEQNPDDKTMALLTVNDVHDGVVFRGNIKAFRLDLMLGPLMRTWLEHRRAHVANPIARAAITGKETAKADDPQKGA